MHCMDYNCFGCNTECFVTEASQIRQALRGKTMNWFVSKKEEFFLLSYGFETWLETYEYKQGLEGCAAMVKTLSD